jgi:hypothetical protein
MANDPHWMEKAFSKNKGSFRKSAQKHGLSTHAFAEKEKGAGGKVGKRANLALTAMKINANR